jgi:hypothetical protein
MEENKTNQERAEEAVAEILKDCTPEQLASKPVNVRVPAELIPLLEEAAKIAKMRRN